MTNPMQLLQEASKRAYYVKNNNNSTHTIEIASIPEETKKQWRIQTALWLMFIALVLWVLSYGLLMCFAFFYHAPHHTYSALGIMYWLNNSCRNAEFIEKYSL